MFAPVWKEETIQPSTLPNYTQHLIILCEAEVISPEAIEAGMNGVRCLSLQSKQQGTARPGIGQRFQAYAVRVFEEIQNIFKDKFNGKALLQVVVTCQAERQLFGGLAGLLKTAQAENPKLIGQLIELDAQTETAGMIAKLQENSCCVKDQRIRYADGKRMIAAWSELEVPEAGVPWKDQGVYLLTGGAGGLGQIFAAEIARHVKDSTLVLTGRSALSLEQESRLKELEALGAKVSYRQTDITDRKAVNSLIRNLLEEFGKLDGIIHGAGIIRDNYIIKKTKVELQEVLAPKVTGLVNLDAACQDLKLDFFICFSSIAGSMGSPGQADYSAANSFMDAYAEYRNSLVALKQRHGQTLAINWPLWKEGGMRVDQAIERATKQNTGIIPLETRTGIRVLYQSLASGSTQVMVMEGELSKLREWVATTALKGQAEPEQASVAAVEPTILKEKITNQLKALFGEVIKLSVAKIDIEEPLESYGVDSIVIIQLNQALGSIFSELSKTIFYEYQTLGALVEYLTVEYFQECIKWAGLEAKAQSIPEVPISASRFDHEIPVPIAKKIRKRFERSLQVTSSEAEPREPIAIIGMSGRYPHAGTLQEFWDNLAAGKDGITEIPEERWSLKEFYHPDPQEAAAQGKSYSKWGGFVEGFADFDPLFFNIAPADAFNMNPQERLFIESCWAVLEDAGYTKAQLQEQYHGRVGVFAGITKTGFDLYGPDLWKQREPIFPHTSFSSVANRISYLFNLQGPSMPIDTMCSSSLTAIHEACEHLYRGECEMAIVGAVNLYLHPSNFTGLCGQKMLSSDNCNRSFGKGGNGFVPGEGVGVVLLKRLSRAIAAEDHIYAVIRGTSINHGGKTNGYTVPNPNAQGELIRSTLDKAGVNARAVSYIEAHGTATELGDPIEITGLTQAFRQDTAEVGYCALGSVKSNIGHLEAAAGIAGITKVILQMQHQRLVPSLHSQELNPNINFAKTPFVVQQELTEWKRPVVAIAGVTKEYSRIAGVSSFGAGGANAHVVLEEYIPQEHRASLPVTPQKPAVIVLSARNEERLKEQVRQLLAVLRTFTDGDLADLAYTLQVGREAMEERLAVLAGSIGEFEKKLQEFMEDREGIIDLYRGQVKRNKETLAVLAADAEMAQTIDAWVGKGKYSKLIDLWVKGLVFDWNKMYGAVKPQRISLPTYPFAREQYWLPNLDTKASGATSSLITHAKVPSDDRFYDQLMDELINDTISMDVAVQKTKKLMENS